MEKILIISNTEETTKALSSSLSVLEIETEYESSFDLNDVIKKLKKDNFKLVIINAGENRKPAAELAVNLRKKTDANLLLIINANDAAKVSAKLSALGIFTLADPFKDWEIIQAVNFVKSSRSQFDNLKKEKDGLVKKVEDMKIIDRAKCCLIHYLRIPEATAHRHIEKQAMDMRCTKRQVAEEILKKYES